MCPPLPPAMVPQCVALTPQPGRWYHLQSQEMAPFGFFCHTLGCSPRHDDPSWAQLASGSLVPAETVLLGKRWEWAGCEPLQRAGWALKTIWQAEQRAVGFSERKGWQAPPWIHGRRYLEVS